MKILIITQYFWPETFRVNDLAVSLANRGNQVTVLTGTPNYPEGKFFEGYGWFKRFRESFQGVDVIRVPQLPRGNSGKFRLILNYLSYLVSAGIFGPIVIRKPIDLIFVFQLSPITMALPAILIKKIKNVPLFLWVQDLWPESLSAVGAYSPTSKVFLFVNELVRFVYSNSDRILIQSNAFESYIKKYVGDKKNIHYLPNSAEKLYEPILNNKRNMENCSFLKGFIILFAGNIGVAQDFDTIIKTVSIVKDQKKYLDIQWVILGDGREKNRIEQNIKKLGLTNVVHFLGKQPIEKMPLYFSYADVLLVTLKKDPIFAITIPSKIQSYLACAKPIIAALEGEGARIISESGAGLSCKSEDPNALAATVFEMYNMSLEKRQKMGKAGRNYFLDNFENDMLVSRLENWMKEEINDT